MVRLLKALHPSPGPLSTAIATALDKSQPIEEERTPYYNPKRLYPTYLGEILNDRISGRYQIRLRYQLYRLACTRSSPICVSLSQIARTMSVDIDLDCDGSPTAMLRSRLTPSTVLARKPPKPNCVIYSSSRTQIRVMKDDPLSGHYSTLSR